MSGFKGCRESLGLTRAQLSRMAEVEIAYLYLLEGGLEDKVPGQAKERMIEALDTLLLERKINKLREEEFKLKGGVFRENAFWKIPFIGRHTGIKQKRVFICIQ